MLLLQNGDVVTSATGVTSYSGLNCNCPASMASYCSVVHPNPDPSGTEVICKLRSGSVITVVPDSNPDLSYGKFCFQLTNTKL